jgi:glycosyltransferase involved in cell wall biosynthesis
VRLLILSTYYAPEHTGNAPYVTQLAEHLSRSHEVTVIASHPHYPEWKVRPGWDRWRSVEATPNLTVIRLSHFVPTKQDSLRRLVYEFTWAVRALAEGRRHRADLVLGVSPTLLTGFVTRWLARWHRARSALMIQDIVSRTAAQSGIKGGRRAAATATRLEASALTGVDGLCTIHPRFAQLIHSEFGVPAADVQVIYNWSHIQRPSADRAATRIRLGWPADVTVVLHSGNMGNKQDLGNVVSAGLVARDRGDKVLFVLAGDGNQRAMLAELAAGLATVELRPAAEPAEFPDFLAAADILLINERAGVFEMSVPSKLTSYLAAGRPVLASTEAGGATAELVLASGGGVLTQPGDPVALLEAVLKLAADRPLGRQLSTDGRAFALAQLSSAAALTSYQRWLEGLIERRPIEAS